MFMLPDGQKKLVLQLNNNSTSLILEDGVGITLELTVTNDGAALQTLIDVKSISVISVFIPKFFKEGFIVFEDTKNGLFSASEDGFPRIVTFRKNDVPTVNRFVEICRQNCIPIYIEGKKASETYLPGELHSYMELVDNNLIFFSRPKLHKFAQNEVAKIIFSKKLRIVHILDENGDISKKGIIIVNKKDIKIAQKFMESLKHAGFNAEIKD